MKAEIDNLPDLPPEAGECVVMYGMPREGDWVHFDNEWGIASPGGCFGPCYLIARPVKPKRLEWCEFNGGTCRDVAGDYNISLLRSGVFAAFFRSNPLCERTTAEAAREVCQRHADEQKRPTAEQPKAETPAIQWPSDAIALTKNEDGNRYFVATGRRGWTCYRAYHGPDPFPPGLDWRKCYIINPACR